MLTSSENPLIKKIRKAVQEGDLTPEGWAVAEGPHLLEEARRSGRRIERVLVSGEDVAQAVFNQIRATQHSQGVIALVEAPVWRLSDVTGRLVVVLDGVRDPGNAGSIIRTSEAFGASGVVILKGGVNPWNPKCLRASAGSLFRLPVCYGVTDVSCLDGYQWLAAAGGAELTIDVVDFNRPTVLVVGNEGSGVSEQVLKRCQGVRIPTQGVESLNAGVAAALILYEAWRRRTA